MTTLEQIAKKMIQEGYKREFVQAWLKAADEFDGIADLMYMWAEELDEDEKLYITYDLTDLVLDSKNTLLEKIMRKNKQ